MRNSMRAITAALLAGLWSLPLAAQEENGTLVFDVKPFASKVKLKEKIEERLKSGGIEWGTAEGQLVVTLVNKRFIAFDLPHMTRYGESKTISLAPGTYQVSCAGFLPEGGFSVEKALSKGAYFNLDVLSFDVVAGATTTIEVYPTIESETTFLLKFYTPQLLMKVVDDAAIKHEAVINDRTPASIAWDDYDGPLKFVPK